MIEPSIFGLTNIEIQFGTMIGTIGAVVLSLALAAFSLLSGVRDRKSRRQNEATERIWAQARQIHWWLEPCPDHPRPMDMDVYLGNPRPYGDCWGQSLAIVNLSEQPVHEVIVDIPDRRVADKLQTWSGDFALGPGDSRRLHFTGEGECLIEYIFAEDRRCVWFSDARGVKWSRSNSGELQNVAYDSFQRREQAEANQERIDRDLRYVLAHPEHPFMDWTDLRYLSRMRRQVRALRADGSPEARKRQFRLMTRASEYARSKPMGHGVSWTDDLFHISTW